MRKIIQFTKIILISFGILFLFNIFYPGGISGVISVCQFDTAEWSVILAGIDILVALLLAYLTYWDQNEEKKKCQYKFEIAPESLCFDGYYALDNINIDSYTYVYNSTNQGIEAPYYAVNVALTKKHCASINVPFILTVQKCPDGEKIELTDVFVSVEKNGKQICQEGTTNIHCTIGSNVTNGMKYLLRVSLLCNFEMEQRLLNSRYFISMRLNFCDCRKKKIIKFVTVEIQNVNGKKIIKRVVSHNSYARLLIWWLNR